MLKKSWIIYNGVIFALLTLCAGTDYLVNIIADSWVYEALYVVIGSWVVVFHALLFFPVWAIVLLVKRKSMTGKTFGIGFVLFLLSLGAGAYCLVSVIGYMGGQT